MTMHTKARARRLAVRLCEVLESRVLLSSAPTGLTPAQVRHAYGFDQIAFGSVVGDGKGQTIAIVDAYDDPNVAADLDVFDKTFSVNGTQTLYQQYGAASTFFTKAKPQSRTSTSASWAQEIALDVEWAHAIAPGAKILLVEAASASLNNLLSAVDYARKQPGVSAVSMSWGASEFSSESSYDYHFTTPSGHGGVTFVASAGDSGTGAEWPAASPNVVSVGGTTLNLNADGSYQSESVWSGGGGGVSRYESRPFYQNALTTSTTKRSTPDIAYIGDPNTGVSVYDSLSYQGQSGWLTFGGTSVGAPQWAALFAIVNQGRALAGKTSLDGPSQTLPGLYNLPAGDFHDVTVGSNGISAGTGYDLASGRGSPIANRVVADLQNPVTTTPTAAVNTATTVSTQTTSTTTSNPGGNDGDNDGPWHWRRSGAGKIGRLPRYAITGPLGYSWT